MSFTLTRKEANTDDSVQAWPLEIECTEASTDLPIEIFVYRRGVGEQTGLNDRFSCVASALQLRTLPVGNPTVDEDDRLVPYFRKAVLRLDCRDAEHAAYIWTEVLAQVRQLSDTIAAAAELTTRETAVIP